MSRARAADAYRRGVKVTVSLSPNSVKMLDALLATGLFGFTRAGVAQEAVYRFLRTQEAGEFALAAQRLLAQRARRAATSATRPAPARRARQPR